MSDELTFAERRDHKLAGFCELGGGILCMNRATWTMRAAGFDWRVCDEHARRMEPHSDVPDEEPRRPLAQSVDDPGVRSPRVVAAKVEQPSGVQLEDLSGVNEAERIACLTDGAQPIIRLFRSIHTSIILYLSNIGRVYANGTQT
jgi:hypothetical protein